MEKEQVGLGVSYVISYDSYEICWVCNRKRKNSAKSFLTSGVLFKRADHTDVNVLII